VAEWFGMEEAVLTKIQGRHGMARLVSADASRIMRHKAVVPRGDRRGEERRASECGCRTPRASRPGCHARTPDSGNCFANFRRRFQDQARAVLLEPSRSNPRIGRSRVTSWSGRARRFDSRISLARLSSRDDHPRGTTALCRHEFLLAFARDQSSHPMPPLNLRQPLLPSRTTRPPARSWGIWPFTFAEAGVRLTP